MTNRRTRIAALLFLLAAVLTFKLGEQFYRWYAFGPEREALAGLSDRLLDEGAEIVRMQARADTLKMRIGAEDQALEVQRRGVEAYGRHARSGALPSHLYGAYRQELDRYNQEIEARNQRFLEWKDAVERQNRATDRYNALSDSIRTLAERISEPYYRIPLPVEAAIERGVLPPVP